MKKTALILALVIFGALGVSAQNKTIGMKKARAIALQQVNGKVKHSKFERVDNQDLYLFEIRDKKGVTSKVKIDAMTGGVIETKSEPVAAARSHKKKHWWIF